MITVDRCSILPPDRSSYLPSSLKFSVQGPLRPVLQRPVHCKMLQNEYLIEKQRCHTAENGQTSFQILANYLAHIWRSSRETAGPTCPRPGPSRRTGRASSRRRGRRAGRARCSRPLVPRGAAKGRAFASGSANQNDELLNCFDSRFDDSFGKFFR